MLPVPERARTRILSLAKKEQERRQKRIGTVEEFRQVYPELTFIIDDVEQPKRKPKKPARRKSDYSGKKKRHTRKQIVTGTPGGLSQPASLRQNLSKNWLATVTRMNQGAAWFSLSCLITQQV